MTRARQNWRRNSRPSTRARTSWRAERPSCRPGGTRSTTAGRRWNPPAPQVESGAAQLAEGWQTLEDSRQQLADGEEQIAQAESEIAENEQKIADGWKDYEEGRQEAQDQIAEGEQEIEDAQAELKDAREQLEDAQAEIDDIEVPEWYVNNRNVLPEHAGFGENAERMTNIGRVFPVLFFLVAALISLTTMTRMVEEERTRIGTMKALGYSRGDIASKYLRYAFYATLGGGACGVLVGKRYCPLSLCTLMR